jgi:hypothetical protein
VLDLFGPRDNDARYREYMKVGADVATMGFYKKIGW